jgi:hypothetical protein
MIQYRGTITHTQIVKIELIFSHMVILIINDI